MEHFISGETRIIVKAYITDLPGTPQERHRSLGDLICQQLLGRKINVSFKDSTYDHIHIPGDFDSDRPVHKYFIYDLNITRALEKEELLQIPHLVYSINRNNDKV